MRVVVAALCLCLPLACKTPGTDSALKATPPTGGQAEPSIQWVDGQSIAVDIGNQSAFDRKLKLIDSAKESIRLGYFIFGFDHSSSLLVRKLQEKAAAGVDVKIMVDGMTAMKQRDHFRGLIAASRKAVASGGKEIQVMYFRPFPEEVWQDLASRGFEDRTSLEAAAAGLEIEKLNGVLQKNTIIQKNLPLRMLIGVLMPAAANKSDLLGLVKPFMVAGAVPVAMSFSSVLDDMTKQITKGFADQRFTFRPGAWIKLIKRFHHKMLVVDGGSLMGGGRNIEDHYHVESTFAPKVEAGDMLQFMDADFETTSPQIAGQAAQSFDAYWGCAKDPACPPKIAMELETIPAGKEAAADADWQETLAKAEKYEEEIATFQKESDVVLHDGVFEAKNVPLAYLENRMYPARKGFEKLAFGEETSRYNIAWETLLRKAKPGDDVVIHNAYVLLPPGLQAALMQALLNGANVRVVTNSATSSNHGAVNVAADAQYLALLKLGEEVRKVRKTEEPPLRIWLYETTETLHTKIGLIGDHMIVGATNADPRSTILDTQNGIVIGPGPNGNPVADQYRAWLETMLARQRGGKAVLSERSLASASQGTPRMEEVIAHPEQFTPDQQMFAYTTAAFLYAMDWRVDRAKQVLYGGFLNTILLNL